jgi:hypothetical protein
MDMESMYMVDLHGAHISAIFSPASDVFGVCVFGYVRGRIVMVIYCRGVFMD